MNTPLDRCACLTCGCVYVDRTVKGVSGYSMDPCPLCTLRRNVKSYFDNPAIVHELGKWMVKMANHECEEGL